jgi:hypothetical protein
MYLHQYETNVQETWVYPKLVDEMLNLGFEPA